MFKLGPEHIGKKVMASRYMDLEWLIPLSFNGSSMNRQIICLESGLMGEAWDGHKFENHQWGGVMDDWEFYEEKKKTAFDFSRFGCNADAVKELVDVLDKRYKRKGEDI